MLSALGGDQETSLAEELICRVEAGLRQTLSAVGKNIVVGTLSPAHAHPRGLTQPGTSSTWHIVPQGVQSGSGKPGVQNGNGA